MARDPFPALQTALRRHPGTEEMEMFGARGFRVRGKVFAIFWKADLVLKLSATKDPGAEAVLLFVRNRKDFASQGKGFVRAARADRLAWLAYPKAGQLGTDVNRDILGRLAKPHGIRPVRQIRIDAVWSALRFRPA